MTEVNAGNSWFFEIQKVDHVFARLRFQKVDHVFARLYISTGWSGPVQFTYGH